ncbi:MAG: DUF4878 domain-containing protein [Acidobacteria bacterium]|nr:DUF4878 domain-containing protein [Acidobacteriota bacterium]MCA1637323.1 DUF4878 domain-containing protein [Acidobacteriota bacterium]
MKIYKTVITAICALFIFGCSGAQQTPSPTETLKTFLEASKKKDVETVKKTFSKGTMNLIEETARTQNTTVDELLKKENGVPLKELPEMRNEKIEGETASVEVKNVVTGDFDTIPLVKEDGNWKVALDKFRDEILKKSREQMNLPPDEEESESNISKPDGGTKSENDSNKSKAK